MRRQPPWHARRAYLLPALLIASLAAACIAGSSGAAPVNGLVGAYSFDAGSGTSVADSSGASNTGTLSGATWVSGKNGKALSFDGVNDWVTIADSASLDLSTAMTLEAWVKPQGGGWRTVALKERTGGLAYALYSSTNNGRPSGEVQTSSSYDVRSAAKLASGTWSHLATTYNGSTLRLYVNGAQVASRSVSGALTNSSGPLRIGGNAVWAEWFSGQLDDLRIYNRALTATELQTDMNTPVGAAAPPPPADTQAPTAPAGLTAGGQTQTQITLNWNASSDNVGVTGYSRYQNGALISSGTGTSFSFTGLACGTSYTLAVDAYDAAGNRSTRPSISASTSACSPAADTQAPTAPAGLTASGQTQTQITLSWNASSDNVGVTGYSRYQNGTLVSSGTGTSFSFTGLACGTSYTLAVDAYDAAGNRSTRPSISASTLACPTSTGPVAAYSFDTATGTTLADNSGGGNAGSISGATWTSAGKSGGALAFDGVNDMVTVADKASLDLSTGMTLEAWVRPSANSTWRTVVTKETSGNLTYGLFSNSDVPQPSAIVSIGSSPIQDITRGPSEVSMSSWTHLAATYDGAVLRLYLDGTEVSTANVTGAMANSAGPLQIGGNNIWAEWFQGQIDDLRVYNRALTPSQLQTDMNTPVAPPPAGDTQAPTAPAGLVVSGQTQTALTLSWNASTDDVGVTGYGTYRNTAADGTTAPATRTYTYTGLTCGTAYSLGVDAVDAAGNRSAQATASGTTNACTPGDTQAPSTPAGLVVSGQTQTALTLSWNASTDNVGVTGYGTYRNSVAAGTTVPATRTYTYTGLTCGTAYSLGVDAVDAAGNRSAKATASGTTSSCSAPPPPTGSANLWVDTNGGSCVRQATAGAYNDAQACSWSQAYGSSSTGDMILVKGGSYGNVSIGPNRSVTNVTFKTAQGEQANVGDFQNGHIAAGGGGASNINFVGPVNATTFRSDVASNVVVDNWNVDCNGCANVQIFHLESANNVVVKNSQIQDNTDNSLIWINGSNISFENNVIHDAGLRSGSGAHTECMYVWSVTNLTLKRNHFYHCSVMDVFITGSDVSTGGFVENNVFEQPWSSTGQLGGGLAFHFRNGGSPSPDPSNWDFRYNTFNGPLSISSENPVGSGGMRIIGNVFLAGAECGKANTTYSYNAFVSGGCGTNSTTNSLATYKSGFVSNADPGNFALTSGSVLRDKGTPSGYPTQDRPGNARTATNDIGAYEYMGG